MTTQTPQAGTCLLIVDDDVDLLEALAEIAQGCAKNIMTASSVNDALKILNENEITAILSDISMPELTGFDFLATIRASGRDMPFVFLTGHGEKEHLIKAIQYEATFFLEKPCNPANLKDVLYKAVEIGRRTKSKDKDHKMIKLLRMTMKA